MTKNQEQIDIRLQKLVESIPLDEAKLCDVDYDRAALSTALNNIDINIKRLAESTMALSLFDARRLGAGIQLANMQKTATSIRQYLGLASMLLENYRSDLQFIYNRRKDFQRDVLIRMAEVEKAQADYRKKKADAARMAHKRADEKAAADPDIAAIQAKKGRRIPNSK